MERRILKTEGGSQELEIEIEESEFEIYYNKAYKEVSKHVQMPGFRKGKVPANLVKKHYGASIESEAIQEAAQAEFEKAITEDEINIINRPELINADRNNGVLKFSFRYEIYPEITVNEFKGITVQEPTHEVTEDEVNEEIQKILNAHGSFEESEEIDDENHVVGVTLQRIDIETKEPMEGQEPIDDNIYLSDEKIDRKLVDEMISRKVGEKFIYEVSHDHDHDHTDHDHDDHDHEHIVYDVQIKEVQKLIPKELTDEFVKEYSKDKFDNVADFKEDMEMQLQKKWDNDARNAIENQIVAKLIQDNPDIPVPETFIENAQRQLVQNFKQQFGAQIQNMKDFDDAPLMAEVRPMAERTVRWELIRNSIVEMEDIKVEDADIEQLATQQAAVYQQDVETLKKIFESNENIKMQILTKKVIDHVMDFAITEEVDFADLDETAEGM